MSYSPSFGAPNGPAASSPTTLFLRSMSTTFTCLVVEPLVLLRHEMASPFSMGARWMEMSNPGL
jgi:hypothetical protein